MRDRRPSGTVRVKHGRYYPVIRYWEGDKRKERWLESHEKQGSAKQALRKALGAMDEGRWAPSAEVMTFGQFLTTRWLPSMEGRVRETTLAGYHRHCRTYLVPQLGSLRLDRITGADLAAFYGRLRREGAKGKPLAENTVARIHATVSRALGDAVESHLRTTNPARDLPRSARPRQGRSGSTALRYWTASQLSAFLGHVEAHGDRLLTPLRLAAYTGMRRGEVIGLRWQDVDLDGAHLAVRQTITTADDRERGTGHVLTTGAPKSGKGRRIDLDAGTVAALRAWRVQQTKDRMALGGAWPDHGLVFTREDGQVLLPDTLSAGFDRLVRAAELPRISLHGLRHTHATILLGSGAPVKVVSERLGHATVQITLDTYTHVMPGMQAQAVADFVAAMEGTA